MSLVRRSPGRTGPRGRRLPSPQEGRQVLEGDDRVEILVRASLPLEQRVDAPATINPELDAACQQARVEFDDVFGCHPCHLASLPHILRDSPKLVEKQPQKRFEQRSERGFALTLSPSQAGRVCVWRKVPGPAGAFEARSVALAASPSSKTHAICPAIRSPAHSRAVATTRRSAAAGA